MVQLPQIKPVEANVTLKPVEVKATPEKRKEKIKEPVKQEEEKEEKV